MLRVLLLADRWSVLDGRLLRRPSTGRSGVCGPVIGIILLCWTSPVRADDRAMCSDSKPLNDSVAACSRLIEADPENAKALAVRAWDYAQLDRGSDGLPDCLKALNIAPNMYDAHIACGVVYEHIRQYAKSVAEYDRALEIAPDSPHYTGRLENRGKTLMRWGKFDEALADLNKALELDSKSWFGYWVRGKVYMAQSKFDLALADFTELIHYKAYWVTGYCLRGQAYLALQRPDKADEDFKSAERLAGSGGRCALPLS